MLEEELETYITLYKKNNIIGLRDNFKNSLTVYKSKDADLYNF